MIFKDAQNRGIKLKEFHLPEDVTKPKCVSFNFECKVWGKVNKNYKVATIDLLYNLLKVQRQNAPAVSEVLNAETEDERIVYKDIPMETVYQGTICRFPSMPEVDEWVQSFDTLKRIEEAHNYFDAAKAYETEFEKLFDQAEEWIKNINMPEEKGSESNDENDS